MTGQTDQRFRCSKAARLDVGDEEILVAVRHRPVERQRDLGHVSRPRRGRCAGWCPSPERVQPCASSAAASAADRPCR